MQTQAWHVPMKELRFELPIYFILFSAGKYKKKKRDDSN